jgi:hypothetical protein
MRLKIMFAFLIVGMLFCFVAVQAETTTEVRSGTVVDVEGNHLVVKMSTGEEKEFDVPDDFKFNVDGKELTVHELKPGTHLTSTITTTSEPKTVYTSVVKHGTVWHVQGNTIIITGSDGKNRQYNDVPDWITFERNGKPVKLVDLRKGMKVSATIVTESQNQVITTNRSVSGATPEEAAPAAAPMAPAEPAPAKKLPKTADNYGILALLGLSLVAVSWKLR